MAALYREACCNRTPRLSVSELVERGFRVIRAPSLPIEGSRCDDAEGNAACFSLDVRDGRIAAVRFRATPCATLIAYCELIAETVPNFRLEIAKSLSTGSLI